MEVERKLQNGMMEIPYQNNRGLRGIKCYNPQLLEIPSKLGGKMILAHLKIKKDNEFQDKTFEDCQKCAKCLPTSLLKKIFASIVKINDKEYEISAILYCLRRTFYQRIKSYYIALSILLYHYEQNIKGKNSSREDFWNQLDLRSQHMGKFSIPIYKLINGKFDWKKENIIAYENIDLVTNTDFFDPYEGLLIERIKMKKIPEKNDIPTIFFEHLRKIAIRFFLLKGRIKVKKIECVYYNSTEICRFDISKIVKNSRFFLDIENWIFNRLVRLHNYIKANLVPIAEPTFLCKKCNSQDDCKEIENKNESNRGK